MIKVGNIFVDINDFLKALEEALKSGMIEVHLHEDDSIGFSEKEELLN